MENDYKWHRIVFDWKQCCEAENTETLVRSKIRQFENRPNYGLIVDDVVRTVRAFIAQENKPDGVTQFTVRFLEDAKGVHRKDGTLI